ncbi:AsnC family transcriptional regulator, partial [Nocardia cyriacigeorgica]|uniref:AsnC family transcriptional regulator n=1 Tax=Nocardia cyriacigeorgica TaxID=135487 RepID=UPI00245847B3
MDSLDRAIIAELEADGRLTNVELAGRVGGPPGPCVGRVERGQARGGIPGVRGGRGPRGGG